MHLLLLSITRCTIWDLQAASLSNNAGSFNSVLVWENSMFLAVRTSKVVVYCDVPAHYSLGISEMWGISCPYYRFFSGFMHVFELATKEFVWPNSMHYTTTICSTRSVIYRNVGIKLFLPSKTKTIIHTFCYHNNLPRITLVYS